MSGSVIGVDVGGTKILAALVDVEGAVVRRVRLRTPARTAPERALEDAVAAAVADLLDDARPAAVGLAAAGFVDAEGETVRFAPHLAWRDAPVRRRMSDRLGVPVHLDNDANAALRGEQAHGAAQGADDVALVALGTGIGAALLLGGELLRGAGGMAGELGHVPLVRGGRACPCGLSGCWEEYASGRALVRLFRDASGEEVEGPEVTRLALAGDHRALAAFAEVGERLGEGLAALVAAFDPALLVIGGGVSAAGDLLLDPARAALRASIPGGDHRVEPRLVAGLLGSDAGAVGAAAAARRLIAG